MRGSTIFVYYLDRQLLETFISFNVAAKHFICNDITIMKYARSRNTLGDECVSSLAPLESYLKPIKNIL